MEKLKIYTTRDSCISTDLCSFLFHGPWGRLALIQGVYHCAEEISFFFFFNFFFRKFLSISQFSCSVMSNCLQPHELQHARPPCPSPTPGVHPNPCPLSWWCHPTISSSVSPFSSCPQSLPASGSFPVSQLFTSGGQSTEFQLQHHSKHIKQENRNKRYVLTLFITRPLFMGCKNLTKIFQGEKKVVDERKDKRWMETDS